MKNQYRSYSSFALLGIFALMLTATDDLQGCFRTGPIPRPCSTLTPVVKQAKLIVTVIERVSHEPVPNASVEISQVFRDYSTDANQQCNYVQVNGPTVQLTTDGTGKAIGSTEAFTISNFEDLVLIVLKVEKAGYTTMSSLIRMEASSPNSITDTIQPLRNDLL